MQFIDLKIQYANHREAINARIQKVLDHGNYIMGPEVGELEEKLSQYVGSKCVTCASGTDALIMALMAYDIGPGDAVFTTPFTFIATAEAISLLGATPVFVDINKESFNIDPQKLEKAIQNAECGQWPTVSCQGLKPKAVIPVDIFGLPADYDSINKIAGAHGLTVIEDAAQSFGAARNGRKAGSLAEISATSFFPAKPLGCYGDGGAVFCKDPSILKKLKSIRVHGKGEDKYDNVRVGINGRLDTIQAAILLEKFTFFDKEIELRQAAAGRYRAGLTQKFGLQILPEGSTSAWAQFSLLHKKKELCMALLKENGIPTAVYYPKPLHLQKAFDNLGYKTGDFPIAENICGEIFSLPMHPYLKPEEQQKVLSILTGNKLL